MKSICVLLSAIVLAGCSGSSGRTNSDESDQALAKAFQAAKAGKNWLKEPKHGLGGMKTDRALALCNMAEDLGAVEIRFDAIETSETDSQKQIAHRMLLKAPEDKADRDELFQFATNMGAYGLEDLGQPIIALTYFPAQRLGGPPR